MATKKVSEQYEFFCAQLRLFSKLCLHRMQDNIDILTGVKEARKGEFIKLITEDMVWILIYKYM